MIHAETVVKPALAEQVETVLDLHRAILRRATLPTEYLRALIDQNPAFLAVVEAETVGFVYTRRFAPDILEVLNIVVAQDFRNHGVGAALLRAVEEAARPEFAAVILSNSRLHAGTPGKRDASAFYLRNGYRLLYSTGPSNIFMKDL